MTLISLFVAAFALHATTTPLACERPLIETLTEIARAAADKDFNAAVRAQQTFLIPRYRVQLEDFEVVLLNAAPQGYLIVMTDHQSIYAGSTVGHLAVREGVLAKRPQFLYEANAPLVLSGRHGAELSPFGLEFEAYTRARGVRTHVLTWQPGVGRFRGKSAGAWLARHPDGYDEPVTLSRGTSPTEPITPMVPLSQPFILLEWTEESLVKR
jgi:hypothetical protein